jgi:hypothetical protein
MVCPYPLICATDNAPEPIRPFDKKGFRLHNLDVIGPVPQPDCPPILQEASRISAQLDLSVCYTKPIQSRDPGLWR